MNPPRRGTPDFLLLVLTFMLVGFGLVMVFSTSSMITGYTPWHFTIRQMVWVFAGSIAMFIAMNVHYSHLKTWFAPLFFMVFILLIMVLVFGEVRNNAKSWFGFHSFGIQPAEFAKIVTVIYLSALISKKQDKIKNFKMGLLPLLVVVGAVTLLILLEPDLGTTMILVFSSLILIIIGGASIKQLTALGGLLLVAGALILSVYLLFNPHSGGNYRIQRFRVFENPWAYYYNGGYQIIQSLYAFGHGGLTGVGLGQGIQKINYLTEAYNDFIFSTIGEELGFIGSSLFILTYMLFLWRGILIALRCTDLFGTLVGSGIVVMLSIQALINLGGVTNSIPLTGVPLPLISYGGSSMLTTLSAVGILLSISREYNKSIVVNETLVS